MQTRNNNKAKRTRKIRELHDYLYAFSMEKCEKFFSNPTLCILFTHYMRSVMDRIEDGSTMTKNKTVYYNALKLILNKIYFRSEIMKKEGNFPVYMDPCMM